MIKLFNYTINALLLMATCFVLYVAGVILYGMITEQNFEDEINLSKDAENIQSISDSTFEFISWNIGYLGLGEESDFFYDENNNQHIVNQNRITCLPSFLENFLYA